MLTAVIRKGSDQDEVSLSLHNVDGIPLYSSVGGRYPNVHEAKAAVEHLKLKWQAPEADADESVILIGKQ